MSDKASTAIDHLKQRLRDLVKTVEDAGLRANAVADHLVGVEPPMVEPPAQVQPAPVGLPVTLRDLPSDIQALVSHLEGVAQCLHSAINRIL